MAEAMRSELRFLALGDSYTIGEAVEREDSWPIQLVRLARPAGFDIRDPEIIAKTAWTTDELMEAVVAASIEGPYQIASLQIGVNNLYRGRPVGEFRTEFRALLKLAVHFAGEKAERVRVLSIPDWGATPFAEGKDRAEISRTTDQFNAVCREEAERSGAPFVDVTESSREGLNNRDLITTDGLHPSGRMYHVWAESVLTSFQNHEM